MKKRIRLITVSALLVALEVVLNRFLSINTFGLKIGFSFVPIVFAAILFGPLTAGIIYGISDFIGALLFPIGPYFPGFTVSAALMGMVYGVFLYGKDKPKLLKHVIPPVLINSVVFGLLINTMWVSILYSSKNYWGWFLYRLPEYAIIIPVAVLLIPEIAKLGRSLKKAIDV